MASKIACLNLTHFGLKIGHKIPPRCSQHAHMTPQDGPRRPKTSPRRLQAASKTIPRRLPDGPRYSQDAPKMALNSPRHPKMLPRRPKTPMDASKTPPDLDFGASTPEFLEVFTHKIVNFWIVWGSFFICEFLPVHMSCHTFIIRLLNDYVAGAVAGAALLRCGYLHIFH